MSDAFKVRASSWGKLFDCAHAWEGTHILGLRMPSSPRALLGKAIHHGTAVFDAGRLMHEPVEVADAVQQAVDQIERPEEDVDWSGDDITPKEMQPIAATLVSKYCREISPIFTFRAVELTTKPMQIDCGRNLIIELTGTMDRCRIGSYSGGLGIKDIKTGARAVETGKAKTKGHAAQIGTYELLTEHTLGEPITEPGGIIGMKTSGKPEIAIAEIQNAKQMMVGTPESPGLIQYAAAMFRSGLFPPNPQSILCSPKYCARWKTCKFHE